MKSIQDLAEAMGFRFSMDWDDQLIIEPPSHVSADEMRQWIVDNAAKEIVNRFRYQAKRASSVLVGGPFCGRPTTRTWGQICCWRRERADWHAYCVAKDGKGYYAGPATSRKKAMELGRSRAKELANVTYHSPHSYTMHS